MASSSIIDTAFDLDGGLGRLIDSLPESEIQTAQRFLEYLQMHEDLVANAAQEAPEDDEPETEEERRMVIEAREDIERGDVSSGEPAWEELGL